MKVLNVLNIWRVLFLLTVSALLLPSISHVVVVEAYHLHAKLSPPVLVINEQKRREEAGKRRREHEQLETARGQAIERAIALAVQAYARLVPQTPPESDAVVEFHGDAVVERKKRSLVMCCGGGGTERVWTFVFIRFFW